MSIRNAFIPMALLVVCVSASAVFGQSTITGNLFNDVTARIDAGPPAGGNDYSAPTPGELDTWAQVLNSMFTGDYSAAETAAASLNYDFIEFTDTVFGKVYYLLGANGSNYWGTYVYNPNYCRDLVIQATHPHKDDSTGHEGIFCFQRTNALFFFVAGTNRCNSTDFTNCTGTSGICGQTEPYRDSDMAHVVGTVFQSTTDSVQARFPASTFVQLHGFGQGTGDPDAIFSNGTRLTPNPDYIAQLGAALVVEDPSLVWIAGHLNLPPGWGDRLLANWNTQGRLLNNSTNHCTDSAMTVSGRFLQVEQAKTILRADSTAWTKMSNAMQSVFPCVTSTSSTGQTTLSISVFPNPFQERLVVQGADHGVLRLFDATGREVQAVQVRKNQARVELNLQDLPAGIYLLVNGKRSAKVKKISSF